MSLKEKLKKLRKKLSSYQITQAQAGCGTIDQKSCDVVEKESKILERVSEFGKEYLLPSTETIGNHFDKIKNINLDAEVDNFIDWYFKNMIKGRYTDIGELHQLNGMRNLIEKMAVWYELRYPDYEINRLMPCSGQESIEVNDVMFNSNKYINDLFDETSDVRELDWSEFYNARAFIKSLPWDERSLFENSRYSDLVYIDSYYRGAHLHLTSKGFVELAEEVGSYTNFKIKDDELRGMHIKDAVNLLKEKGVLLPSGNELEETIKDVEKWDYQREEMLNCVMYRIIERGGNRIGPRRAFLFAKEFERNIDIPMMYGVDYSDPGLRSFVIEYIKAGGSKDLLCYIGYFSRASQSEKMDTVSVAEILRTCHNDCVTKYTPEETALHQRMVNVLACQCDKGEVKQLRLQRRL